MEMLGMVDAVSREAMLFAAAGFFIGGLDDLLIDILYLARRATRGSGRLMLADLPPPETAGRLAMFVPAWDEAGVIGAMLSTAVMRLDHPDYRIFVGVYPNDRATIDAVAAVAANEPRIVMVVGDRPGPTTKADCLNNLWSALGRHDARRGRRTRAVILHDAEDVVHGAELRIHDRLIGPYDVVQLPVLPLVDRGARLVSGTYADEFAESHIKQMVVRTALGAGMPLAGVGCAIATDMLDRVAGLRGGDPFDAESLVEDYELGLRIADLGGRSIFARVVERPGDAPVAVRAYFPATIAAAVRQRARWMTGIALAGWDRIGWSRLDALGDHWMRMRDRRAPLAVLVLGIAYVALVAWSLSATLHWWTGTPVAVPPLVRYLLLANAGLLLWRIGMRTAFTARAYGWREALWSVPRLFVGNYIALLAARRAITRYVGMLRGAPTVWDKTGHVFPDAAEIEPIGQ